VLQDRLLAAHVLQVHSDGAAPARENGQALLSPATLRAYIAEAKQHDPHIPEGLTGLGPGPHGGIPTAPYGPPAVKP
jgi:DNA replicative helicase MCM subunit Mcm2 (Cdc46/Mcm family)